MHDTTGHPDHLCTRRLFLQRGLTFLSLAATTPLFIERSARALAPPEGSLLSNRPGVPEDRVLVIVQLSGGNDGLNTVIPYGSSEYYKLRPGLAVPAPNASGVDSGSRALPLQPASGLGLHPSLAELKDLFDDGAASIVQGVGYPNPNRSHFTSMDIWHTADPNARGDGWIGRYFDHTCEGEPDPEGAVSIGRTAPRALLGATNRPVSFENAELFRWLGEDVHESLEAPYDRINRAEPPANIDPDSQRAFLMRTALNAQVSSDRIRKAVAQRPLVSYPRNPLSAQLQTVAALIRGGMNTRVYYVSQGGFDTHAGQAGRHASLLRQLAGALKAFHADLKAQDNAGRVLTMVFSEFGRRVAQNASGGTDHGTAAPMYFVGDPVRPGVLGDHPSMARLDQGDLVFNVDFRCIYAAILEDWMGADAAATLGRPFRKAKIIKA
ncbi:MAG: DUF1501 domain-containing protein [Planctomycetota bacterium]|nr:DUF1501 domain-containing protein [Planctomycetota bacterium]